MIWKVIILMALTMMITGALLNEEGISQDNFNQNITQKTTYDNMNLSLKTMGDNQNNTFTVRSVYKYADFLGFVTVEGMNTALKFGYNHPNYNFRFLFNLIMFWVILIILVPLFYVLTFLGFAIYYLVLWIKKLIKHKQSNPKTK